MWSSQAHRLNVYRRGRTRRAAGECPCPHIAAHRKKDRAETKKGRHNPPRVKPVTRIRSQGAPLSAFRPKPRPTGASNRRRCRTGLSSSAEPAFDPFPKRCLCGAMAMVSAVLASTSVPVISGVGSGLNTSSSGCTAAFATVFCLLPAKASILAGAAGPAMLPAVSSAVS